MKKRSYVFRPYGIRPFTPHLWDSSQEKLREAKMGLLLMRNADNRLDYESGWQAAVLALNLVWHRFYEEGRKKLEGPFLSWAAKYKNIQNTDPLVQYITEARNQLVHGKSALLIWGTPCVYLSGEEYEVCIGNIKIYADYTVSCEVSSFGDLDKIGIPLRFDFGAPSLPVFENRKDKKHPKMVPPPQVHLETPIKDGSPVSIIELCSTHYESMLIAAIERFSPEPNPT